MKYLHNPELRHQMEIEIILLACGTGGTVGLVSGKAAICVLVSGLVIMLLNQAWNRHRYVRISRLSYHLDEILHSPLSTHLNFNDYKEGELAILQNELQKMTVRFREQAEHLKRDKYYLMDSIADISHQLRTPLTSMNLILSFMEEQAKSMDDEQYVREMEQLTKRIDWLIESLLKMSKIDADAAGFREDSILLAELVEKSCEPLMIPMELREQILEISVAPNVAFVGDFKWMQEAIGNLVKNAMEHTPNGGRICLTGKQNPIYTELLVEDTGKGFEPEEISHLFERFYKGKHASESSVGIGLALAKMIIVGQNGAIQAENRKEGGARFRIRFYNVTEV